MKIKRSILAMLAFGAVLATAACGSTTPTSSAPVSTQYPTENVKLTLWWWGEQEVPGAQQWLTDTIAAYRIAHPNVTIDAVLQTTDGLIPGFEAAAAAKQGPDIQYFWGGIYSQQPYWSRSITPVSDLIPAEELKHYTNARLEDSNGDKTLTAPWYVNPQFPVLARTDVLSASGLTVPKTWDDLLKACDVLSAQGITTLAGGVKDGWFGGWLYSMLGAQSVTSKDDVVAAVLGKQSFTDPLHADWWTRLQETRDHKCWNNDINSLELYQAQQLWVDGKAAMTITAGTDAPNFVAKAGADRVEVTTMPTWGTGPYAGKMGTTSQTVGVTSWTKYPQVAADFIMFMHTPDRLAAWFTTTGSLPADDRFDMSAVSDPVKKSLFTYAAQGAPYLENFIPSALDSRAVFTGVQLVLQGSKTAAQAASDMQAEADRERRTDRSLIGNFTSWSAK